MERSGSTTNLMESQILKINHTEEEGYHLLTLSGEIDASTAKDLDGFLNDITKGSPKNIVFDLANVEYISSAGIGLFIYYSGEIQKQDQKLVITQPNATVREILTLLALDKYIPITATKEEGLEMIAA